MQIWRKQPTTNSCLNSNCDHICIPTNNRGRKCACSLGYKLTSETTCSNYKSFLIIAQEDRIRGIGDDSIEAMVPIHSNDRHILHIDLYMKSGWIYWIEYGKGSTNGLWRIHPNGTELQQIISKGIGSNGLRGLTIDWISKQIYFTNAFPHETFLEICNLEGGFRKILSKKNSDNPRELAVNPVKKFLYWIDYGTFPRIGRALLDGSNWTELVTSGITNPKDLTIDFNNHDVYWIDATFDNIQKINYQGGNRVVIKRNVPNPVGISVFRDYVYWADKNLGSVFKFSLKDSSGGGGNGAGDLIRSGMSNLKSVKYYDSYSQPEVESYCGVCEQLCYAIGERVQCDCATGMIIY